MHRAVIFEITQLSCFWFHFIHSSVNAIFHLCPYGMMLEIMYFCAELVQLIVSRKTESQKCRDTAWRRILRVFDCWSYHVGRRTVNEQRKKNFPKAMKLVFEKPNCRNCVYCVNQSIN